MTERAAAARHPALGAPATRAGTGLAVGEIPRRPESPAGLATSKHVPDSHHPTPSLSSLSCSQVASTALCSPRRHEYKPKHGNKGRTGNRPGLCLDTVLSAHLRSGNIRMDPVGAGPPWEHSCPVLTHRIHTHRPVRQEPQASPDQRLPPRPHPSSHLYPDAKSAPAACQARAKRGKPEDALRLGEQNSHWPGGVCWPQENADGGGRNTAVTHTPAPSKHQAHSAAWT